MALKTFNIDAKIYSEFSKHCKKEGLSMSRKIENFIRAEIEKLKMPQIPAQKKEIVQKIIPVQQKEHSFMKYC